jgi:hypothetical protein
MGTTAMTLPLGQKIIQISPNHLCGLWQLRARWVSRGSITDNEKIHKLDFYVNIGIINIELKISFISRTNWGNVYQPF